MEKEITLQKRIFTILILLIWSLTTIVLTISVVGLLVLMFMSDEWFPIPEKCLNVIIN